MPSLEHEMTVAALAQAGMGSKAFAEQRAFYDAALGAIALPANVPIETVEIAGREADLVLAPGARSDRVVLHLHGGGYVLGSNRMYREFSTRLSLATGLKLLVPDYRLAPENQFPAALDDAEAAYRWLLQQGHLPREIAISGDSAGGGLALALAMRLRDSNVALPAAMVLMSPWTDLSLSGPASQPGAVDDPVMDRSNLIAMARAYAGEAIDHPSVSPSRGSVAGLPPILIFVGTRELLFDDARDLAASLAAAGVEHRLIEGKDLIHCWPVMAANAPESHSALSQVHDFLAAALSSE
ncbi:alpha/beta hydrolase [Sphingomonas sp. LY54]|uniref:alpha/beta hydrolase n=1 Tax=Sphingomonadales TaxID=204457 RepID=UPI002ADEA8FD|nr:MULTISPECIES: alpha/beta hydrolase [Sphingomonadales]MEA1015252.1 alpha/beta hydrolase [Sphingosinicella sp. LY1275]WRP27719.1 alpha/beta hydrolase [Sphingomonas sp. LY54]